MSTTSTAQLTLSFTGDVTLSLQANATANQTSPGTTLLVNLATGFNSIAIPPGSNRVTIEKPAGNTVQLTLKGITGDTGQQLGLVDFDSFSLPAGATTLGVTAASGLNGVRFIFN
jgi:hypothetical protein